MNLGLHPHQDLVVLAVPLRLERGCIWGEVVNGRRRQTVPAAAGSHKTGPQRCTLLAVWLGTSVWPKRLQPGLNLIAAVDSTLLQLRLWTRSLVTSHHPTALPHKARDPVPDTTDSCSLHLNHPLRFLPGAQPSSRLTAAKLVPLLRRRGPLSRTAAANAPEEFCLRRLLIVPQPRPRHSPRQLSFHCHRNPAESSADLPPTTNPMPQPLSAKEASLFRSVIRAYEDKQYKRGLKSADLILKKVPKHGDTMAMKALIMNAQGKTDEAFALGKEALTVDMKSHICWHVYGLLYRANKNYEEAIKAYKFALRLEPESAQIQRDLAILQVQMRDYAGYIQSRTAMLQARPQLRQSWTALAIAHHLSGDLSAAENVLTTYEGTLKATPSRADYENSEAIMYKNTIIAEQGDYQRALDHLESAAKQNLDRLEYLELRAKYLLELGKKEEAIAAWEALVERNADRPAYFEGLEKAHAFSDSDKDARKQVYDTYAKKFPRSDAPRRLPLNFLTGDEFRAAAKEYLTLMFNKGVPSTFANLKHLYADSAKKEALEALAQEYIKSQSSATEAANGDRSKGEAAALYFLAQHYNYHLSRDLDQAHKYIDQAIEKVKDSVDFHMTKARIYKHQGDLKKASETMDQARLLDTKDRYINTKAAKYQLRNNEREQALKTVGLFTRADTVGGPLADLLDMQCVWFLTEDGEAAARLGDDALALKRFHTVHNIFDVWQEDQFDFHSFSLRKGQIRAYIDMVRWEDHLRDHPFYSKAALEAIQIYLKRADRPATNGANGAANGDDASERKKAAKKAKKEQQRLEREAAERAAKQDPNKGKASEEPKKKDDDPLGLKLLDAEPLSAAMRFVTPLLQFSPQNIEAQFAGFDVYLRRKKYILALRSLNAARALDESNAGVQERAHKFAEVIKPALESLPAKVQEVIKSEFKAPA
ncbi:N-terminal acetyltransferase A complex subunit nat1 [Colletotrichum gloeosporioides]|uniref:N-terminal acetyltransferase A complex subunit nat1 n=2 Tax=Colletotrichum gloeosporioides TaxID=474922 RepID=A0A8H4CJQ9_COLGL|nr:N-terminal acetyltransferase A complex subunit nat1 [Colletotrichum gloeosporioides]KAF3805121.1 N-terminal acetyltransferase A complex subunit nat1 [Colletotrichum gloeosporioides]